MNICLVFINLIFNLFILSLLSDFWKSLMNLSNKKCNWNKTNKQHWTIHKIVRLSLKLFQRKYGKKGFTSFLQFLNDATNRIAFFQIVHIHIAATPCNFLFHTKLPLSSIYIINEIRFLFIKGRGINDRFLMEKLKKFYSINLSSFIAFLFV